MEGFVYILKSKKTGQYYVGSSGDPEQRLVQHNSGKTKAIRNKGPWILKFKQSYTTIQQARQVEYKLKKLRRRDYIETMIREGRIRIQ